MFVFDVSRLVFIVNWVLIIIDASLGYFVLPVLLSRVPVKSDSEPGHENDAVVAKMRRLLTFMVLLYMLVNCYAFFESQEILLYIVTALIVMDIIVQLAVGKKRS